MINIVQRDVRKHARTYARTHARTNIIPVRRKCSFGAICAWDAFALDEKVCFTALRSLKKYDPGAQCGIEYYVMYCKFAREQKYEFLIFRIFVVQGKKMPIHDINKYTVLCVTRNNY